MRRTTWDQGPGPDAAPRAHAVGARLRTAHTIRRTRLGIAVLATGTVGAVLALDAVTPADFRPRSLLWLLPFVIAMVSSWVVTAFTALVVAAGWGLLYVATPGSAGHDHWSLVGTTVAAASGVLAVALAHRRTRAEERIADVDAVAEASQRALMRPMPGRFLGLRLADAYLPAAREARVGGDWYDFQPSPHGTRIVLGDVSGKGLAAVSASAALLSAFREAAFHEPDLTTVADRLEVRMRRRNLWDRHVAGEAEDEDLFSTGLLLNVDERDGTLDVLSFGHEAPLLIRDGRVVRVPVEPGLPLGMAPLGAPAAVPYRMRFRPGDLVLMTTDGVTECRDADGAFYPLEERVRAFAADGAGSPGELVGRLLADLAAHRRGAPEDDTAVIAVQRTAVRAESPLTDDPEFVRLYGQEYAHAANTLFASSR
ncbi:PP2C family protein-serine/threonine phosphatase [Streptomyces albiaxialis]|uniref:PP2C family protein-serine/threonine phosphatase n=1 Tax=Streptomyces albiaxialis TaxID=329523 RepID=A0ABN2VIR4_9ACTN